jgi:magnesium transporter
LQVIAYSLTFLVGAGGNASAQSAVIVVRGIATEQINRRNEMKLLWREVMVGAAMGLVVSFFGFLRVYLFSRDVVASLAIGSCLFLIVLVATSIGALLPFILQRLGTDPAHAGPAVQVIMDIIGVATCCIVCTAAFAAFDRSDFVAFHAKDASGMR